MTVTHSHRMNRKSQPSYMTVCAIYDSTSAAPRQHFTAVSCHLNIFSTIHTVWIFLLIYYSFNCTLIQFLLHKFSFIFWWSDNKDSGIQLLWSWTVRTRFLLNLSVFLRKFQPLHILKTSPKFGFTSQWKWILVALKHEDITARETHYI